MAIEIYTRLDDLFDARRGIITKVAIESGNEKFDWTMNFSRIYARRRFDYFHQPELGIDNDVYQERYKKRTMDDFADETQAYIRPSKLMENMFRIVRSLEFGEGQMLSVDRFNVTVNLHPYVLSDELVSALENTIRGAVPFMIGLSFVTVPYEDQLPRYLHNFNYVFQYNFLTGEEMKPYWDAYPQARESKVKFIVPDVLANNDLPEEMMKDTPMDLIGKMNVTQGGKITWVPVSKAVFDYKE